MKNNSPLMPLSVAALGRCRFVYAVLSKWLADRAANFAGGGCRRLSCQSEQPLTLKA